MTERTDEPRRRESVPEKPTVTLSRGRVRQALLCPYCRDGVARRGSVACARKGCGTLYHRECWDECAASYGGCAVYGCGSQSAHEVSAAGYFVRLAKLVLAALLFPPRLARRIVASREPGAASPLSLAHAATKGVLPSRDQSKNGPLKFFVHLTLVGVALWTLMLFESREWLVRFSAGTQTVARVGWIVGVAFFLPYVLAFVPTLVFYVLRSELAALLRADVERATVLTRLREGKGKK